MKDQAAKVKKAQYAAMAKKLIDSSDLIIVVSVNTTGGKFDSETIIAIDESVDLIRRAAMSLAAQKAIVNTVLSPIAASGGSMDDMISHLAFLTKEFIEEKATANNAKPNQTQTIH